MNTHTKIKGNEKLEPRLVQAVQFTSCLGIIIKTQCIIQCEAEKAKFPH